MSKPAKHLVRQCNKRKGNGKGQGMKIWKQAVLSAGVGLIAGVPVSLTAFAGTHTYSAEAENEITTGDIAISIAEYEINDDGEEEEYRDGACILPGQRISKIVRITNEAEDAWIRVKVDYGAENTDTDHIDTDNSDADMWGDEVLAGIDETWKKVGEYYYYTNAVSSEEQVDFFREIRVPSEWDKCLSGQEFALTVTAQAIQKANFEPDFSGEAPWFGVPIESCVHSQRTWKTESGEGTFEIIFENGTEGFVKDSSDFFEDFSSMMPGDTMTGTLEFGSHFGRNLSISFRSEIPENQTEESVELLKRLELIIQDKEQILYKGTLWAESLTDGIELIRNLKEGETRKITYAVSMPEDLDNAFALRKANVRWIFTTSYSSASGGSSGGGVGAGSDGSSDGPGAADVLPGPIAVPVQNMEDVVQGFAEYLAELPGTGDSRNGYLFLAMLISGGAAFFLSSGEEKREKKKEEAQHE